MPKETERHVVQRLPKRGVYDRETIHAIIDEALICHVSFVIDEQPYIIPTIHARMGDELLLHGLKGGRMLKHVAAGNPICVAITLLDGLVLARSVFNSSMNYRSAVLFGRGRLLDGTEKATAFEVLTEHLVPGRWADSRQPNPKEVKATSVIAMTLEDASAKIRTGHPDDDEEDYALPYWAGVIPLELTPDNPVDDERLSAGIEAPRYATHYTRRRRS